MSKKIPSPCIDVCKFRREGHCIGCSMTKAQKKLYKSIKKQEQQEAFLLMLTCQQAQMGRYTHWEPAYLKKLKKKKVRLAESLTQRFSAGETAGTRQTSRESDHG
ncbi:DUF1289 domain-containing protein [Shimia sp. R9_1]|uniref:DUF1289 domain-containing protein n=1 Tax=Shimia sp. R9_1 TaxID=2821111 RepID=UPI001ADAAE48|nr:DUF1289 domain-containing protein [Shimia sp. R9_1]MBO9409600.1 DUF1289 domain-containing protein [Shimia sp. R9_1]